jgi:DNA polymerase-1
MNIHSFQPNSLWQLYSTLSQPLSNVFSKAESRGIKVDIEKTRELEKKLCKIQIDEEKKLYDKYGRLNYNSADDCINLFINKLKLQPLGKTETGKPLMNKTVFVQYEKQGIEVAGWIRNLKRIDKIINTYIRGYIYKNIDSEYIIHPNFNLTGTVTGRLSSSRRNDDEEAFNIQNLINDIKLLNGEIVSIRELFIPRKGYVFVHTDASQSELRILGWYSNDEGLCYASENDLDLHSANASSIFQIELKSFIENYQKGDIEYKTMRHEAKTIGFAWVYGAQDNKVFNVLGGKYPKERIKSLRETYWKNKPFVLEWKNTLHDLAYNNDKTFFNCYGRRRILPSLLSRKEALRLERTGKDRNKEENELYFAHLSAYREGLNFVIQSTSVDYIGYGMLELENSPELDTNKFTQLIQTHDSDDIEVEEQYADYFCKIAKPLMEKHKMPVDIKMKYEFEIKNSLK